MALELGLYGLSSLVVIETLDKPDLIMEARNSRKFLNPRAVDSVRFVSLVLVNRSSTVDKGVMSGQLHGDALRP